MPQSEITSLISEWPKQVWIQTLSFPALKQKQQLSKNLLYFLFQLFHFIGLSVICEALEFNFGLSELQVYLQLPHPFTLSHGRVIPGSRSSQWADSAGKHKQSLGVLGYFSPFNEQKCT